MTTPARHQAHPRRGWFKSSFSPSQGGCVEVNFDSATVRVRDTKDRGTGPVLTVDIITWPGFIAEVTGAAAAGSNHALRIEQLSDGRTRVHSINDAITLTFTSGEWTAFTAGAASGDFTLSPAA